MLQTWCSLVAVCELCQLSLAVSEFYQWGAAWVHTHRSLTRLSTQHQEPWRVGLRHRAATEDCSNATETKLKVGRRPCIWLRCEDSREQEQGHPESHTQNEDRPSCHFLSCHGRYEMLTNILGERKWMVSSDLEELRLNACSRWNSSVVAVALHRTQER